MRTLITNANMILQHEILFGYLLTDGKAISVLGGGDPPDTLQNGAAVVNAQGRYLAPGFIELHTHGAGGCDYMDGTVEGFITASMAHLRHGTTSLLPTTLAASREETARSIDCFAQARREMKDGPNLLGIHMEGPYLNPEFCGAINPLYIRNPHETEYKELIERSGDIIRRWTIAPELPGAMEMGAYLSACGILPSIGHSGADYATVLTAVRHGFSHITHLYSSMSTVICKQGFRYGGVLESGYLLDGLTVEIIADGCHLPGELLQMVYRFIGPKRTCLVCDSMRSAGTDVTDPVLGSLDDGRRVIVEDGVAKLPDRSAFAGSIATDDRLVRVCRKIGIPLTDCIQMMCETPARVLNLEHRKGSLKSGKDADLILFDDDIHVSWVMVGGQRVWSQAG